MSLFARSIGGIRRQQYSKIQSFLGASTVHTHHTHRCITSSPALSMEDIMANRIFSFPFVNNCPTFNNNNSTITIATTDTSFTSIGHKFVDSLQSLFDLSTWLIKRTFQPSIIRKRRKHGFRRRKESVGGNRVLKRRLAKGRMRLGAG